MTDWLQELINFEVDVMFEGFRRFSLRKFKAMEDPAQRLEYAVAELPLLGEGSARTVFAIGAGKVLKAAGSYSNFEYARGALDREDESENVRSSSRAALTDWEDSISAGKVQNEEEVGIFTNPKLKPVTTKIIDFANDYTWLVAEAVKPLANEEELEQEVGVDMSTWEDVLELGANGRLAATELQPVAEVILRTTWRRQDLEKASERSFQTPEELIDYLTNDVARRTVTKAAWHVMDLGHLVGDITDHDHWGRTVDGRLVLLDYGFTEATRREYYGY